MDQEDPKLKIQFESELELARVVSRGRLAEIPSASVTFAKGVNDGIERVRRGLVEAVEQVKYLTDQVEADAFAKPDPTRNSHVHREVWMRDSHIAAEVWLSGEDTLEASCVDSRLAERAVRQNAGPLVAALQIAVRISNRKDVERPARAVLNDRSD